jgi:REP element-mobilizing transposase RayT
MFNPDIHHRQSIRFRDFDYSSNGAYFVTICAQGRECLFGNICDGEMELNEVRRMVESIWQAVPHRYTNVVLDEFMIMPNHFHGIIILNDIGRRGDTLCSPAFDVGLPAGDQIQNQGKHQQNQGEHKVRPYGTLENSLGRIMQAFKSLTSVEYVRGVNDNNWQPFPGRLWQRNYYERIIRDEAELNAARKYITENPMKWAEDKENPAFIP